MCSKVGFFDLDELDSSNDCCKDLVVGMVEFDWLRILDGFFNSVSSVFV